MKRFLVTLLALSIAVAVILGGCTAPTPAPAPKPAPGPAPAPAEQPIGNITLSFGTTNVGSASYAVGAAVTRLVQKYNPTITATIEVAGGGLGMLKLIKTKELEFGYSSNIDMYNAYRGTGDAKETGPQNVRTLWTGHTLLYQWITCNPKIRVLKDVKGATIWWRELGGAAPMALGQATVDYCIQAYGWKESDIISADRRTTAASMTAAGDGTADVASTLAVGGAETVALAVQKPDTFWLIPFHDEAREYIMKKWPMFNKAVVPKGLYQGLPKEDVPVMGALSYEWVDAELPDNVVYAIVKAVFDHLDEFQQLAGPTGKEYTLKNAVYYPVVPFHSGVIKYFKEKGIWTPELEKKQQELLAEMKKSK